MIPRASPAVPRKIPRLLAIVDVESCLSAAVDPLAAAAAAADAGSPAVVLRARNMDANTLGPLADAVFRICRYSGALGLLAGDVGVACASGAAGVHLKAGGAVADARALFPGALVGVSVHNHAELIAAAGADFVAVSPVASPRCKATDAVLGLDGLASLCRASSVPVLGLGGVDPEMVGEILAAGAYGVAALTPFSGTGGRAATAAYLAALRRHNVFGR